MTYSIRQTFTSQTGKFGRCRLLWCGGNGEHGGGGPELSPESY